jgi:hypothetical protein
MMASTGSTFLMHAFTIFGRDYGIEMRGALSVEAVICVEDLPTEFQKA